MVGNMAKTAYQYPLLFEVHIKSIAISRMYVCILYKYDLL